MKWHTFQPEQSSQNSPVGAFNLRQGSPRHDNLHKVATAPEDRLAVEEEKPTRPLLTIVQGKDAPASQEDMANDSGAAEHLKEEAEQALEVEARQVSCPL